MKNPFRFGGRWSWLQITAGGVHFGPSGPTMTVSAQVRWWHPGAWLFLANYIRKHVRLRIEWRAA